MKVVYTDEAIHDPDDILKFIAAHFPSAYSAFESRLQAVKQRIGRRPESARQVAERPGVRVVPLLRYPYNLLYRVTPEAVEILHIRHSPRREP